MKTMTSAVLVTLALAAVGAAQAQPPGQPPPPAGPPPPAQQAALVDLTGYWASIVTEDWRWRMLTPPHGDYASVPLNPAGRQLADQWTTADDGSCKAYYAAGLMRMPTRVHISWTTPNALKVQTDWGEQTRTFYFRHEDMPAASTPSPQGVSFASWLRPVQGGAAFGPRAAPRFPGGKLYVVTTQLAAGWLRRNGVPYGEKAQLSEWYQIFDDSVGKHWFDVTTQVQDPEYLAAPFITSSDFRQESDNSRWAPHPCKG
jgi:hypothetical protein